jgi:hypothetical protein
VTNDWPWRGAQTGLAWAYLLDIGCPVSSRPDQHPRYEEDPDDSVCGADRRERLQPLARRFPRAAEEQERQRHSDPGQHQEGHEGGLEALVQHDEPIRALVRREVIRGAGDSGRRDDGDAERDADLERRVAEARGEPGLVLGDVRERVRGQFFVRRRGCWRSTVAGSAG